MTTNRFSKISMCLAAATLLIIVGFVWLSFPETSSEESHVAGALMASAIFDIAAMIGVAFGAIGIVFAVVGLIRKERPLLVLLALVANLPILILSGVILIRSFA